MQYIWDFVGSNAKYFGKLFWKAKKMLKRYDRGKQRNGCLLSPNFFQLQIGLK